MYTKTKKMAYIGLSVALITVCSWISIPASIPFTLQTFAIFLCVGLFNKNEGIISVFIYILLGIAGVPVFGNFTGGIGVLLGPTGGYIFGFLIAAIVMRLVMKINKNQSAVLLLAMLLALGACYLCGTLWFMLVYFKSVGYISFFSVLSMCVMPFVVPDILKILLSFFLIKRLKKVPHISAL